jgi:N-acetylglutamate synthase-like GNAT family acetyltransferase
VLREARPEDLKAILHLDPVLEESSAEKTFEQIVGTSGLHLFVLERGGAVITTTYLNVVPNLTRSASPYAIIENVVVEESLRSRGFGKEIMAGTLQAAWDAGCYKVMLLTGSRRLSTHAFYLAYGFLRDDKTGYVARPS